MAISKIILNGVTQMDLTGDTVEANNLLSPYTAHKADGTQVTGTASGGGTDFIVNVSYDDSEELWVPDCTFAEIQSAYSSGKNIAVKIDSIDDGASGSYSSEHVCFYYTVHHFDYDENCSKTLYYIFDTNGVTDDDSYSYYATFNATAVPSDVAQGKVFYNSSGEQTGTSTAITPTGTKTISITENGTTTEDVTAYASAQITVNVSSSGSSKNIQIAQGVDRVATTSYTAVNGQSITVAKTGTYDVYWSGFRSSTSGTSGSQLYIGSTAYGSAQTTFTNHGQSIHLSNVSLSQGDIVTVRARARNTSYFMYVGNLTIVESA